MDFTKQEIATIQNDYLNKHGIYTGISHRSRRSVNTRVVSTYWTPCPFVEDYKRHEKYTVESETNTFIKFHQKPYRFRFQTIKKGDGYSQLQIAYRDTALNKRRFHFGGDDRIENQPSWAEVKHFTDVMVRWDDADHTIDEDYDQIWFLPNKVMYVGVEAELKTGDEDAYWDGGKVYSVSKVVCSPTKTERTPTAVPVYTAMRWKSMGRGFRRNDYDGDPIADYENNLNGRGMWSSDDGSSNNKILLLDGAEVHFHRQHNDYHERKALTERFIAQCETTYTPFRICLTVMYQPNRKTTTQSYGNLSCVGMRKLTEMKHSALTKPFKHEKLEAMRKHKEAFAEELVRTCLAPERMERLYGEKFVDIVADL